LISIYGELGAGKTSFIKGICNFFEVNEMITSPTFTIMNQYVGNKEGEEITLYHIDLYRIKSAKELEDIGFCDCIFSDDSIKLIEWADKSYGKLPDNRYSVQITPGNENEDERAFKIKLEFDGVNR
jgi:tRNA threonylcarbamoyladenosine biosynthesis protein TsaE